MKNAGDEIGIEAVLVANGILSRGHFAYESGHHGDLWLDLDALFVEAVRMRRLIAGLAEQTAVCRPDFVCGPLTGGAFVAQFVAAELDAGFVFSERCVPASGPVQYKVPSALRARIEGHRVLIVDDAVNAGSALLATLSDALACNAEPVGFASLITLGDAATRITEKHSVPFFSLMTLDRGLWTPETCPLCAAGEAMTDPGASLI